MERLTEYFRILKHNLDAALIALAYIAGCKPAPDELDTIGYGIFHTDLDLDIWYGYSFNGHTTISFRVARDEGDSDILSIGLNFDAMLKEQIALCMFFVQEFTLQVRNYKS